MRCPLTLALFAVVALFAVTPSPVAAQSSGRVYLVPLGPGVPVPLRELADHYRQTYKLNVIVLPELALGDPRVQDTTRFQLIADELLGYMVRKNPKPSSEPGAAVIGVTVQDMYIRASMPSIRVRSTPVSRCRCWRASKLRAPRPALRPPAAPPRGWPPLLSSNCPSCASISASHAAICPR